MQDKFLKFLQEYKTYIILVFLVLLMVFVYTPVKDRVSDFLLSKKEVKILKRDIEKLKESNKMLNDSIDFYKKIQEAEEKTTDSSKIVTVKIKQKTHEEIKTIPTLPVDSNIRQFPRDLEEYLRSINNL